MSNPPQEGTHRNPNLWGPSVWALLLDAAAAADDDNELGRAAAFLAVLEDLRILLPCPLCRASYGPFLDALEPAAEVAEGDAVTVVWRLKNLVHMKLATGDRALALSDLHQSLERRRRSCDFDRDLVLGVLMAERRKQGGDGKEFAEALERCWPVWMELVDVRASLLACPEAKSREA